MTDDLLQCVCLKLVLLLECDLLFNFHSLNTVIDNVAVVVDCFYMAIFSTLSSRLTVLLVWFSFGSSLTEEDR